MLQWWLPLSFCAESATALDIEQVAALLGRRPQGDFSVVLRAPNGEPRVVRNAPLLHDGTPMPTRFWLVDPADVIAVSRLEAAGGVNNAESEVDDTALQATHDAYATERDAQIAPDHVGPRPFGGVAGTRRGVKCLHAHYANWLVGNNDPVGRWVANRLTNDATTPSLSAVGTFGAIDIGSNSTNLLIIDRDGHEVVREVNVTALGEGVAHTKVLSAVAIARTMSVIERYTRLAQQHDAVLSITGTAACRMAHNTAEFFAQVQQVTGVVPQLLSAADEARLAWHGAVASLPTIAGATLVVDIGGASTELTIGEDAVRESVSLPFGVVSLTEAELHSDPPRAEELANAISIVSDAVDNAAIEYPALRDAVRVVGVAGSIVTIAAVELGLQTFDAGRLHGMVLSRAAAEDVFRTLATESLADRVHNPGLPLERAGVIVGGCCLLVAIMRRLHLDHIIVSTHNLLDGSVAQLRERLIGTPTSQDTQPATSEPA